MKRYQSLDVFVNQVRLHELLIDGMANGITNLHPHYSRELIDMVIDILLNTDFPDIRVKSFIQSKDHGAVMTIPREGGYLCRFYVELDMIDKDKRASDLNLSEQDLIAQM
ncbi:hypothetical protein N9449_05780 [Oceanospirillaceae bacterium]|nr:hypothetical protein [Oceanospirillaceae bacterium]